MLEIRLRQHARISRSPFWDYEHHALVATIRTELPPHENVARQVFHGDGILAFLRCRTQYHCSMCLVSARTDSKHRLDLDEAAFNHKTGSGV